MANFTEDSRLENWLKLRGVKFGYRTNIRYAELIPNWHDVNQGRPDSVPQDPALVEKYASAMEAGAIFPAPVLAETPAGFDILDGLQRLTAGASRGQTIFNGYIIKSDDLAVRASIRVCANSVLNGTAPSQDWTISRVVDVLFEQHQYSAVDCATWSGQSLARIEQEISSRDAARWLRNKGIDINVKPANQKGFLAAFAKLAPLKDRIALCKELPELVRQLQSVKANNSEAISLLEQCLDVSRVKGVDIPAAVRRNTKAVFERPEIQARMSTPRALHPVDNVVRSMAGTVTATRKAAKDSHHADPNQARQIFKMLKDLEVLCKKVVTLEAWAEIEEEAAVKA